MPKITVRYNRSVIEPRTLKAIDITLSQLVAEVCDFDYVWDKDVDFYSYSNRECSRAPNIAIEVEIIAFPGRKERIKDVLFKWRDSIVEILNTHGVKFNPETFFILVKYVDPDSVRV